MNHNQTSLLLQSMAKLNEKQTKAFGIKFKCEMYTGMLLVSTYYEL